MRICDRMNIQNMVWLNDRSFVMEVTDNEKAVDEDNINLGKNITLFKDHVN